MHCQQNAQIKSFMQLFFSLSFSLAHKTLAGTQKNTADPSSLFNSVD